MEAKCPQSVDFFLGTTTPVGFHGYFQELGQEPGMQLYLIKSGPGCGKSTMMKQLAQLSSGPVQRIHCSSDPDSLDGVVFCDKKAAILDATAPHTMEPLAPGADEVVVSLYHTMSVEDLHPHREEIRTLFARNASLRSRAARYIASAGSLLLDSRRAEACSTDFEKARRYVKRLCARLLPRQNGPGTEQIRLLSAITPQGPIFYTDTIRALADRAVVFRDEYGAASRFLMEQIHDEALARGYEIITCPCALHPEEKIDHILIPSLQLAFLTDNSWHPVALPGQQSVRCTRFLDRSNLSGFWARLRFNSRAAQELIQQSTALMASAKSCHDELESYYRAAVNFETVEQITRDCARVLGLDQTQLVPKV